MQTNKDENSVVIPPIGITGVDDLLVSAMAGVPCPLWGGRLGILLCVDSILFFDYFLIINLFFNIVLIIFYKNFPNVFGINKPFRDTGKSIRWHRY